MTACLFTLDFLHMTLTMLCALLLHMVHEFEAQRMHCDGCLTVAFTKQRKTKNNVVASF